MKSRNIAVLLIPFAALACDALVSNQFTVSDAVCSSDDDCLMNTACDMGPHTCRACRTGFDDCDGNRTNGCEVELAKFGRVSCDSCVPERGDCDGVLENGCEVNLLADQANCGVCEKVCALLHADATCTSGQCMVTSCNNGYGDCDDIAGCETELLTNKDHCGSCATACMAPAQGTLSCENGKCLVESCPAGFSDCNQDATDGCEVNTTEDLSNCGNCNHSCASIPGSLSCVAGKCVNFDLPTWVDQGFVSADVIVGKCDKMESITVECGASTIGLEARILDLDGVELNDSAAQVGAIAGRIATFSPNNFAITIFGEVGCGNDMKQKLTVHKYICK